MRLGVMNERDQCLHKMKVAIQNVTAESTFPSPSVLIPLPQAFELLLCNTPIFLQSHSSARTWPSNPAVLPLPTALLSLALLFQSSCFITPVSLSCSLLHHSYAAPVLRVICLCQLLPFIDARTKVQGPLHFWLSARGPRC